jgi:ABC-type transporter Mla subunit MlaD
MSQKASYFKLGLFVIIGTALALAGVAVLGAGAVFQRTIVAETYMEESVQGLDVGAPVRHRGVQVGKVSRIAFVGEEYKIPQVTQDGMNILASYVLVEMELDVSRRGTDRSEATFKAAIQSGMHVRMASSGLVGIVYLDLYFAPDAAAGPEITWEPRTLYIPSTRSMIAELTSTISTIAGQLEKAQLDVVAGEISQLVKTVESKVGAVDVEALQRDAGALLGEVRASNARLKEILDAPAIQATLDNLAATSGSLRKITGEGESDLGTFVKDLPEISARLKSSAAQIDDILKDDRTQKMMDGLAEASEIAPDAAAEVRRVAQRVGVLLRSQESDLQRIIQQLAKTAENLQRLTEDASKNPSRVIFGEPPPPTRPGTEERR